MAILTLPGVMVGSGIMACEDAGGGPSAHMIAARGAIEFRPTINRLRARDSRPSRAHVETLKTDVEQLKAQLGAAEARADHETAKAERAIAGFSAPAERLAALAEDQVRPMVAAAGELTRPHCTTRSATAKIKPTPNTIAAMIMP